ncbi:MAG: hypothetical protein ACOYBQ_10260 [Fluviibacter sp.]
MITVYVLGPVALHCENPGTVAALGEISGAIHNLENVFMGTLTEHAVVLAAISVNVTKMGGETRTLLDKIAALTAAVEAANQTTPEIDAAVADLQTQVAIVDALVPDAPTPGSVINV